MLHILPQSVWTHARPARYQDVHQVIVIPERGPALTRLPILSLTLAAGRRRARDMQAIARHNAMRKGVFPSNRISGARPTLLLFARLLLAPDIGRPFDHPLRKLLAFLLWRALKSWLFRGLESQELIHRAAGNAMVAARGVPAMFEDEHAKAAVQVLVEPGQTPCNLLAKACQQQLGDKIVPASDGSQGAGRRPHLLSIVAHCCAVHVSMHEQLLAIPDGFADDLHVRKGSPADNRERVLRAQHDGFPPTAQGADVPLQGRHGLSHRLRRIVRDYEQVDVRIVPGCILEVPTHALAVGASTHGRIGDLEDDILRAAACHPQYPCRRSLTELLPQASQEQGFELVRPSFHVAHVAQPARHRAHAPGQGAASQQQIARIQRHALEDAPRKTPEQRPELLVGRDRIPPRFGLIRPRLAPAPSRFRAQVWVRTEETVRNQRSLQEVEECVHSRLRELEQRMQAHGEDGPSRYWSLLPLPNFSEVFQQHGCVHCLRVELILGQTHQGGERCPREHARHEGGIEGLSHECEALQAEGTIGRQ
mmetsp:Transcript_36399/g.104668  ORF Transcript_36399/g.104668 Transcript_36399/m.104668 type:complete len:536 (-) Transcript_36399:274-1881(-)